jgi:UTP--glucose-1-phosphate uridylyltransferase
MSIKRPTKAVIAAAGFGTRFLPQTKAMPKEMLPLIDKPIIQYVVEELASVGVKDIIIVTGYSKRSIEDHFDRPNEDLSANLRSGGPKKESLLTEIEAIADLANFAYVRQKRALGNAAPLLYAQHLIGQDEPFIYTWADDFIQASPARFQQMIDLYTEYGSPIMSAVRARDDSYYDRYGIASGSELRPGVIDVETIVEKPGRENAPSELATVSGFLLTADIFGYLRQALAELEPGKELVTGDILMNMRKDGSRIIAAEIQNGTYYDAGDKLDYIKTVVDLSLKRPDIGEAFRSYLKGLEL